MATSLSAPADLGPLFDPREAACNHLPGPVNRLCSSCDAFIIAGRIMSCPHGHLQPVRSDAPAPVRLWCGGCDDFADFTP